jgi:G3E family GTPase
VPFARLADWLGGLVEDHGERLLRVKGIVAIEGEARPVVVHGVQHVFHPPRFLDAWPKGIEAPAVVFIFDGLDAAVIRARAAAAGLPIREVQDGE